MVPQGTSKQISHRMEPRLTAKAMKTGCQEKRPKNEREQTDSGHRLLAGCKQSGDRG